MADLRFSLASAFDTRLLERLARSAQEPEDEPLFAATTMARFGLRPRSSHNEVTRAVMEMGATVDLPPWREVLRRDPCSYCGAREDENGIVPDPIAASPMTIDHIVPRSATGESRSYPAASNAAPACRRCNNAKGSQTLLVFLVGGAMRPSLAPARPSTVRNAMEVLGGGLLHSYQIATAMGVDPYQVGMELAAMRTAGVVERVGQRWRLRT